MAHILPPFFPTSAVTNSELSLSELANFLKALGVEEGINLDGGSSSSFYYQGKSYYGKLAGQSR